MDCISTTGTNFLKHVFSESVPDLANIVVAEANCDKDTLVRYLEGVREAIGKWITEIEEYEVH